MPLVGWVVGLVFKGDGGYRAWHIGPIEIGAFLGEVLNFLAIAAAVFVVVVKIMGSLVKKAVPAGPVGVPVVKECPRCISEIPIKATRCKYCTTELGAA
jgi:large conductance mechanosensitive channel